MKNSRHWSWALIILVLTTPSFSTLGFAQKIKVGYDKTADFSKYKTYTWAQPDTPVTRPILYASVQGTIDDALKSKGLTRIDKNGDLTLIAAGGIGMGVNMPPPPNMNTTNWSGQDDPSVLMDPLVAEGSLILEFIDRTQNKMIWRGTVTENVDPEMAKALPRIEKAIVKLLKRYPPKRSSY